MPQPSWSGTDIHRKVESRLLLCVLLLQWVACITRTELPKSWHLVCLTTLNLHNYYYIVHTGVWTTKLIELHVIHKINLLVITNSIMYVPSLFPRFTPNSSWSPSFNERIALRAKVYTQHSNTRLVLFLDSPFNITSYRHLHIISPRQCKVLTVGGMFHCLARILAGELSISYHGSLSWCPP